MDVVVGVRFMQLLFELSNVIKVIDVVEVTSDADRGMGARRRAAQGASAQ
jgi:hypothetical protein